MRRLLTLLALIGLLGGFWLGLRGLGPLPPLGGLLDPANGAWAAARFADLEGDVTAKIPRLESAVAVRYDRRGVPHIFAGTVEDAMRALGYVVARDRLFQLDAQTHAASGRLTEWAGARALPPDSEMRHLGLPRAAERSFAAMPDSSRARRLAEAYADGVNAWIDGLSHAQWPIEYKLLGRGPERWQPINSVHLFNRMGWTLAHLDGERQRWAAAALVGDTAARALFPRNAIIQEPIVPNGSGKPRFDFHRLPPPGSPDSVAALLARALGAPNEDDEPRSFASNNWAVAPSRTKNGHALLAGDPHLELTLPSIWYEVHIVVPGTLDVYGVTIPGAPGVVIGFNRDLAWSFTNTGADVLDYFRETVDDSLHPTRYMVDGVWRALERRLETYRDQHGRVIRTDTTLYTARGPLERIAGRWLSMRWLVLENQLDVSAFVDAPTAHSSRDFLDRMAKAFGAPAQNMISADRTGAIAIRSTGHFPYRPGGDGLEVRDGSRSANDWRGFWPLDRYPQAFSPQQGFLASANQQPLDPKVDSTYLGYEAAFDPWRALMINQLLRADSQVTTDDMRRFQTNPGSVRADLIAPYFVAAAKTVTSRGHGSPQLDSAASMLEAWDRQFTRNNERTILYQTCVQLLPGKLWDELSSGGRPVATPSAEVMLELLQDPKSPWWDDRRTTDKVEDRDDILASTLAAAWESLVRRFGPPGPRWAWGKVQPTRIMHLLSLPGFSATGIPVQGGAGTLNPAGPGGFGPSWRMVVELGDSVTAMGTYPGGQSGNPVSDRYLDRLPFWRDGRLDTLFTPRDTAGLGQVRARLTLVPGGTR